MSDEKFKYRPAPTDPIINIDSPTEPTQEIKDLIVKVQQKMICECINPSSLLITVIYIIVLGIVNLALLQNPKLYSNKRFIVHIVQSNSTTALWWCLNCLYTLQTRLVNINTTAYHECW